MGAQDVRYATEEEISTELRRLAILIIHIIQDETMTNVEKLNKIREGLFKKKKNGKLSTFGG